MSYKPKPTRQTALETATKLTCGDRNESYGPPFDNLSDCAALWTSYLNAKYRNTTIAPHAWNRSLSWTQRMWRG